MADQATAAALTLAGIVHRCAQETALYFSQQAYNPDYCYELFRRAIVMGDPKAHECLYTQYQPLVAGWVERHPSFAATGEDVPYFINVAFEKLWRAVPSERFHKFPNLKSLLQYLKMCVHSAIVDYARRVDQALVEAAPEDLPAASLGQSRSAEEETLDALGQADFWTLIRERLTNRKEELVVYGSFHLALKPRDLYARFEDSFDNVTDVYRTKQNVLERLRRDEQLKSLLLQLA
jgi:hypothetical protein